MSENAYTPKLNYVSYASPPAEAVVKALAAVMAELPNIGKGDKSPEGYAYRGIEAVTKHVQPLFAKHGIVIVPSATVTEVVASPAMKDGWQDVYMAVEWRVFGPDGSSITARTNGIGRDRADKGANKAQTQAFKYLLLHLLCIADGKDDADSHTYEAGRSEPELPQPLASPETRGQIRAWLETAPTAAKNEMRAWWKVKRLPPAEKLDKFTEYQAGLVLEEIERLARLAPASEEPGEGAPTPLPGDSLPLEEAKT